LPNDVAGAGRIALEVEVAADEIAARGHDRCLIDPPTGAADGGRSNDGAVGVEVQAALQVLTARIPADDRDRDLPDSVDAPQGRHVKRPVRDDGIDGRLNREFRGSLGRAGGGPLDRLRAQESRGTAHHDQREPR